MTDQPDPPRGKGKPIDCRICAEFYVTWDKGMPYGCRGHGFKSRQLPSIVVFSSSGVACLLYKPKFTPKA